MRYKRARVESEIAGGVQREMPDASDAERAAEVQRRAAALKKEGLLLEQWGLDEIHADLSRCGLAGSPTKVFRVQAIVLTKEGYTEIQPTEAGVPAIDPRIGGRPDARIIVCLLIARAFSCRQHVGAPSLFPLCPPVQFCGTGGHRGNRGMECRTLIFWRSKAAPYPHDRTESTGRGPGFSPSKRMDRSTTSSWNCAAKRGKWLTGWGCVRARSCRAPAWRVCPNGSLPKGSTACTWWTTPGWRITRRRRTRALSAR